LPRRVIVRAQACFRLVLLLVVLSYGCGGPLAGHLRADDLKKVLTEVELATELHQAELKALHMEFEGLCDPALTIVQTLALITEWGCDADDPEPALAGLERIASAAKGTPFRRAALFHLARLMSDTGRQEEAIQVLTTLAIEAVEEAREGDLRAREDSPHGELREWEARLSAKEAELAAHGQRLEEQSARLREYAKQIRGEQGRLEHTERRDAEPVDRREPQPDRQVEHPDRDDR
jgi:hypothetical protein